jgi:hypothetical protein
MDWLTIRFRIFCMRVRIGPTFWLVGGILGYLIVQQMAQNNPNLKDHKWGLFGVWMACWLVGLATHEIGSVLLAWLFGTRSTVVFGIGSTTQADLSRLRLWQRISVHLAGPLIGLACYALVMWVKRSVIPDLPVHLRFNRWVNQPVFFLEVLTYWYNLISLLPLLPMNGGKVVMEIALAFSPAKGMHVTYGWSFLCCVSFVIHAAQHWNDGNLQLPFGVDADPQYTVVIFGYYGVTNLIGFIKTWPPRRRRHDDEEPKTQDAAWA